MTKICIVEDDERLACELVVFLEKHGYTTNTIQNFKKTLQEIIESAPDLVVLDLNLPYTDGMHICRELRKVSQVPIIILTSQNSEMNELLSLNIGADDFIAKPFNPNILLARIELLLRKANYQFTNQVIKHRDLNINFANFEITSTLGSAILTKNESIILKELLEHKNSVVGRDQLMYKLWNSEEFIDDNTLTVNVTRLRQKMKHLTVEKEIIETRRGLGYIIHD